MAPLDSSKATIQPEVGLERADRFIHHVQWEYLPQNEERDSVIEAVETWQRRLTSMVAEEEAM